MASSLTDKVATIKSPRCAGFSIVTSDANDDGAIRDASRKNAAVHSCRMDDRSAEQAHTGPTG